MQLAKQCWIYGHLTKVVSLSADEGLKLPTLCPKRMGRFTVLRLCAVGGGKVVSFKPPCGQLHKTGLPYSGADNIGMPSILALARQGYSRKSWSRAAPLSMCERFGLLGPRMSLKLHAFYHSMPSYGAGAMASSIPWKHALRNPTMVACPSLPQIPQTSPGTLAPRKQTIRQIACQTV
mgnify:CR=1 FL=1